MLHKLSEKSIILIGYSGHAFVLADALIKNGCSLYGYMDKEEKKINPFNLPYLGREDADTAPEALAINQFIVAVGNNNVRRQIFTRLAGKFPAASAIHPGSHIGHQVSIGDCVAIMAGTIINSLVNIQDGVIINSGAVIEHECHVGSFAHIAPGAVLTGNVSIGENTFVGAGAVIRQGITIGRNVTIGAGAVIVKDLPDGVTAVGNPGKIL